MYPSSLKQIKKRIGPVAEFNGDKILIAMSKAFAEVRDIAEPELMRALTAHVIEDLEARFTEVIPGVEDVQNVVESVLMEEHYFDVAKAYIIYRYEHAKVRDEKKHEVEKKLETGALFVVKRTGDKELFAIEKIKQAISYAIKGYEDVINLDAIVSQVRAEIYEDIPTEEISRSIIMVLRSFIEHDPAYSYAAAQALLLENYKIVIGFDRMDFNKIDQQLRETFVANIRKGVQSGKLDPRMLTFDLEDLSRSLMFERDKQHTYLSAQTLVDRYFLRETYDSEVMETPQSFWMRVAMGLSILEEQKTVWAKKFYTVISTLRYVPSTPTLFHAGTTHPQMSSCYLTTVEDDLSHIFKCIGDNAQLAKWSGGIGNDWSNLRGTGALIKATGVGSQGVIPFLKIANDTTSAINRSGRRRGATCAYLEIWHWDIEHFLELRKNTGDERRRTHDMNTANWIPDLFMKRVRDDGEWSLFSPEETSELHHLYGRAFEKKYEEYERKGEQGMLAMYRKVRAREFYKKMLIMLFETGHPWFTWKDPCNIRSPQDHVGVVHSSNLCTEITLNTSADETAVCNLGSVNLERHVTAEGTLDQELVRDTVTIAMRMLDNVIDANYYPTKEARNSNLRHRPVGLGIMGFQNALYKLNIPFDSEACVRFADESMEVISYYAILGSAELARERGPYQSYRGSKWDRGIFPIDTLDLLETERGIKIDVDRTSAMDWSVVRKAVQSYGMRNSNCLAMAPTATISNIAGTTPTIEPIYKNMYVKANQAGDFTVVNPYLVSDLKKLDLWDGEMVGKLKYHDGRVSDISEIPNDIKRKYKEVFEIDTRWLIRAASYRGKWIDQSQSLNIFYAGRSGKEMADIYMHAWEMGLKTTYYLRTLAASQVEKSTVSTEVYGETHRRKQFTETTGSEGLSGSPYANADVSAAPHKAEISVPNPVTPVRSLGAMSNEGASVLYRSVEIDAPQMCKIDDPDCEACQ